MLKVQLRQTCAANHIGKARRHRELDTEVICASAVIERNNRAVAYRIRFLISKSAVRLRTSDVQTEESKKQSYCEGNVKHQGFEKLLLAHPLQ